MGIFEFNKFLLTPVIVLLFALPMVACGGGNNLTVVTPTPEPTATSTPEPPPSLPPDATVVSTKPPVVASDIQLKFVVAKRDANNQLSVLQRGGTLTPDDTYGIFFSPVSDAFVYVFQKDSTQSIDVLFPNPEYSAQTNPVPGGMEVWVPKDVDHWFFLDENVGEESFIVVATQEKNEQLEAIISRPQTPQGELTSWLLSPDRGVGGVKSSESTPVAVNGDSTELEQSLLELQQGDGSDLVFELDFQHEAGP